MKKNIKEILTTEITFQDIKTGTSRIKDALDSAHKKICFLNTFLLKLLAIITMTIDHTAVIFGLTFNDKIDRYYLSGTFPMDTYKLMRYIGRIAFPIFCYLIVEGFFHTRNVFKYSSRLLIFAFISQVPFYLMLYSVPYRHGGNLNVYFTLFLGLLAITVLDYCIQKYNSRVKDLYVLFPGIIIAILVAFVADFLHTDYGALGVAIILVFYLFRKHPISLGIVLWLTLSIFSDATEMYALWALIAIFLHNGKKGPGLKYFFYLYYPLHILILFFLKQYII